MRIELQSDLCECGHDRGGHYPEVRQGGLALENGKPVQVTQRFWHRG